MHTRVGCTAEKAFAIYGAAARASAYFARSWSQHLRTMRLQTAHQLT